MSFIQYIKLFFAFIFFIPKFLLVWSLKLLTFVIAPIISLPVFVRFELETDVTGYPSQFEDKKRAFLIKPLMGFQTHDDCLDAFWYSGKYAYSWMKKYTQEDFDTKWWVRYCCYVAWLWRNPAYQFADWLGWRNKDCVILKSKDEDSLWKTGVGNFSYWIVKNDKNSISFQIQGQIYYYKQWCVEFNLGYGFQRWEPDDRCMLNSRFIPWRKYSLVK